MERVWSFAEIAMEGMFQQVQLWALKSGVVITREEFWRKPGTLIMTPQGYMQLMRAGVIEMAFQQEWRAPARGQFLERSGRN